MKNSLGKIDLVCPDCGSKLHTCTSATAKHVGQCSQCNTRFVGVADCLRQETAVERKARVGVQPIYFYGNA